MTISFSACIVYKGYLSELLVDMSAKTKNMVLNRVFKYPRNILKISGTNF